eukprot:g7084.t1
MDEVDNADKVTPELDNRIAEQLRPGHFSTRKNDFEKHHFCPLSKKLLVNPCKVTIIKTVADALKTAEKKKEEIEDEILDKNSSNNEKGEVDIKLSNVTRTDIKVFKEDKEKGEIQQQKEKKTAEPSNSTNEDMTYKIAELERMKEKFGEKSKIYQKVTNTYLKLKGKIFDKKSVEEYLKKVSQDLKEDNEQKQGDTDVDMTWWKLDEDDDESKKIKDRIKSIKKSVGFLQFEFLKHMHELQSKSLEKDDIDSAIWSDTISDIEKMYITNFDRQEFFKENNRKQESSADILLPLQLAAKYGLYNVTSELLRPAFWESMINVPDMEGKTCLFYLVENMFESQKANMKMLGPPSEGIRSLEIKGKDKREKYKKEHELQGILSSLLTDFEKRSKNLYDRKELVKVFSSKSCSEAKNHRNSPQIGYSLFYELKKGGTKESTTTENNTKYGGADGNLEWCRLLALLMVHGAYLDAKDVKGKCIFHLEYCKLTKNRMTLLEHINRVYLWGLPKPESSSSNEDVNWTMKLNKDKCWYWDYEQEENERFTNFFKKMKNEKVCTANRQRLEVHWNLIKSNVKTEKDGTDSHAPGQMQNNKIKCSSGKLCKSTGVAKFYCPHCGDYLNPEYNVSYCNNKKCSEKIEGMDTICEQCMFDIGERWKDGHECLVKGCKGRIKGFWLNCKHSQTQLSKKTKKEEDVIKSVSPDITAARYLREVCQTVLDAGGEYELCSTNKSGCNFLTILSYCDQATLFGVINNFDARHIFTQILLAAVSHPKVAQGFNITKLMIKQKADLNGIKMDPTGLKRSAIVLAARSRNFALCKQLISNGAKISVDDFHSIISYLNLANVAKNIEKKNAMTRDRVNSEDNPKKRRRSSSQLVKPQTERINEDTLREFCRLILFFGAANGSLSMNLIDSMKKSMTGTKIENWMIDTDDNGLTCLHYAEILLKFGADPFDNEPNPYKNPFCPYWLVLGTYFYQRKKLYQDSKGKSDTADKGIESIDKNDKPDNDEDGKYWGPDYEYISFIAINEDNRKEEEKAFSETKKGLCETYVEFRQKKEKDFCKTKKDNSWVPLVESRNEYGLSIRTYYDIEAKKIKYLSNLHADIETHELLQSQNQTYREKPNLWEIEYKNWQITFKNLLQILEEEEENSKEVNTKIETAIKIVNEVKEKLDSSDLRKQICEYCNNAYQDIEKTFGLTNGAQNKAARGGNKNRRHSVITTPQQINDGDGNQLKSQLTKKSKLEKTHAIAEKYYKMWYQKWYEKKKNDDNEKNDPTSNVVRKNSTNSKMWYQKIVRKKKNDDNEKNDSTSNIVRKNSTNSNSKSDKISTNCNDTHGESSKHIDSTYRYVSGGFERAKAIRKLKLLMDERSRVKALRGAFAKRRCFRDFCLHYLPFTICMMCLVIQRLTIWNYDYNFIEAKIVEEINANQALHSIAKLDSSYFSWVQNSFQSSNIRELNHTFDFIVAPELVIKFNPTATNCPKQMNYMCSLLVDHQYRYTQTALSYGKNNISKSENLIPCDLSRLGNKTWIKSNCAKTASLHFLMKIQEDEARMPFHVDSGQFGPQEWSQLVIGLLVGEMDSSFFVTDDPNQYYFRDGRVEQLPKYTRTILILILFCMALLVYVNVLQAIIFERWQKFQLEKLYEKNIDYTLRIEVSETFLNVKDKLKSETCFQQCYKFVFHCNKNCLDCGEKFYYEDSKDSKFEAKLTNCAKVLRFLCSIAMVATLIFIYIYI